MSADRDIEMERLRAELDRYRLAWQSARQRAKASSAWQNAQDWYEVAKATETERDALRAAIERIEADAIEQQKNTGTTRDPWQLGVYAQASRTRRILRDALDTPIAPESTPDGTS